MVANLHSHHSWWHKILVKIVSLERVLVKPEVRFYSWLRSSHWNNNSLVKKCAFTLFGGAEIYIAVCLIQSFKGFKSWNRQNFDIGNHYANCLSKSKIVEFKSWNCPSEKNEVFFVIRKFHKNVLRSNRGKFKVNAPILHFIFHISVCMHYTDKVEVRFIAPNFRKQY